MREDRTAGAEPLRLRPTGAPAVTAAAALVVLAAAAGGPGGSRSVPDLLLVVCPAVAVAAVFLLPVLVVDADGLDVVGVLRRRRVPWAAVARVRQGWFVELELHDGSRVTCLAAPVVASMAAFRTLDEDDAQLMSRRSARHPAFPGAHGSLAVELVEARRPAGSTGTTGATGATGATGTATVAGTRGAGPVVRVVPALLLGLLAVAWAGAVAGALA